MPFSLIFLLFFCSFFEVQGSPLPKEKEMGEFVSSSFYSEESSLFDMSSSLDYMFENYSWFFDSRKTKQELVLVPTFFMSQVYSVNWGLRFFTFSPEGKGYHLSFSLLNQILKPYVFIASSYEKRYSKGLRLMFDFEYSNYFEPYYGEGTETLLEDREDLYANKFMLSHQLSYHSSNSIFYGLKIQGIFRREIPELQEGKIKFSSEAFVLFGGMLGYDDRDHQYNAKEGQFHQFFAACVPSFLGGQSSCILEGDFRSYFSISDQMHLALRWFIGTAVFSPLSYSLAYSLGGPDILRGFTEHRFRGDKAHFFQGEYRSNLWKELLSGVVFFEMGQVASYGQHFKEWVWDYGLGLRVGFPPSYDFLIRMDLGFSTKTDDRNHLNFIVDFQQSF